MMQGTLPLADWEALSMTDRAKLMAAAVRNGYTDIRSIRAAYANFQNQQQTAGNMYKDGGETSDFEVLNPLDDVSEDFNDYNLFASGGNKNSKQQHNWSVSDIEQRLIAGGARPGVDYIVTSRKRKPGQAGNAGNASAHVWGGAVDIKPGPGKTFDDLFAVMNTPQMISSLAAGGYDILDETDAATMKKTGATGKHYHVGRGIRGQKGIGEFISRTNPSKQSYERVHGNNTPQIDYSLLNNPAQELYHNGPKAPVFTEEDQRLLNTPINQNYTPEYIDRNDHSYKSSLAEAVILDETPERSPMENWALFNNMLQNQQQDDPMSWMTMMASINPNTTTEQRQAADTMYQLFAPTDGDYNYTGLNFASYGGSINKFEDGGFYNTPEQRALARSMQATKPYNNYEQAVDMEDSPWLRLKKFIDRGVSNCTLTASQFFNPARPIGRARTIVQDSIPNGFYEVDENHVVPGTMVIASYPNMSDYNPDQKYHTMVVTGFAPNDYEYTFRDGTKYNITKGEPIVSYSRGKASADNYVTGIPLSVYNDKGEGKTFNRYYRPIDEEYPEYMLPNLDIIYNK